MSLGMLSNFPLSEFQALHCVRGHEGRVLVGRQIPYNNEAVATGTSHIVCSCHSMWANEKYYIYIRYIYYSVCSHVSSNIVLLYQFKYVVY